MAVWLILGKWCSLQWLDMCVESIGRSQMARCYSDLLLIYRPISHSCFCPRLDPLPVFTGETGCYLFCYSYLFVNLGLLHCGMFITVVSHLLSAFQKLIKIWSPVTLLLSLDIYPLLSYHWEFEREKKWSTRAQSALSTQKMHKWYLIFNYLKLFFNICMVLLCNLFNPHNSFWCSGACVVLVTN